MGAGEEETGMVSAYRIVIAPSALKLLSDMADRRVQAAIRERIEGLAHEPERQGKPLTGELSGYRSLRVVGQRYRIVYRVGRARLIVSIIAAGIRKEGDRGDVYALAKKLLRLRLLEPS